MFESGIDSIARASQSLQAMLDNQLVSMRAFNPANFGQDPSLHFITQRYAMLTTSLLLLNADYQVNPCTHFTPCLYTAHHAIVVRCKPVAMCYLLWNDSLVMCGCA